MSTPSGPGTGWAVPESPLEGGFDDVQSGLGAPPDCHAGDVEADLGVAHRRLLLPQPPGGQAPQAPLLLARDSLGREPEAGAAPGLDLAEHDAPVAADDQVEFPVAAAPVAAQHLVALAGVPRDG